MWFPRAGEQAHDPESVIGENRFHQRYVDPAGHAPANAAETPTIDRWLSWKQLAKSSDRLIRSQTADELPAAMPDLDWGNQELLEASLAVVAPVATDVVAYFYDTLFARLPALREFFPEDMSTQHDRLLAALFALVTRGNEPATLVPALEQLGRDHRKFSTRAAQYDAVGKALIAALSRYAGPAWTPEVEAAWLARYGAAATVMIRAAEADDHRPPFWYGTIIEHKMCGRDVAILRLRPHLPYPYVAGQHATLESARLPRVWRPYSIANAPRPDQMLEFHVRAIGRGGVSDALVTSYPGDVVRIGPPQGSVTLGSATEGSMLFVAGGTGWSMIKALLGARAQNPALHVPSRLLVVCRPGEPYDPNFEPFVSALPNVATTLVHDSGRLRAEVAQQRLLGWNLDAFVSGPPGLAHSVATLLDTASEPHVRIHHDNLQLV